MHRALFIAAAAFVACTDADLVARRGGTGTTASTPVPDRTIPNGAWFVDVTDRAGITRRRTLPQYVSAADRFAGGVCVFDADSDGSLDLFFPGSSAPRAEPSHLYMSRGRLRYADETAARGLGDVGRGVGCLAFDADGDGDHDLLVTGQGGVRLFRNDGGRFVDVSSRLGAPIASDVFATSAVAFDADGDGDLDLAIGSFGGYRPPPEGTHCFGGPCEATITHYRYTGAVLLLQRADGTFEDATDRTIGRRDEPALALLATDLDGDGRIDLFVGNDLVSFRDRYFRRLDDGSYRDDAEALGVAFATKTKSGISTMSAFDGDVDNDGHLDLVESSNDVEPNPLFRCSGAPITCVDVADALELFRTSMNYRWGQALVDFDHDGVVELFEAAGHWDAVLQTDGLSPDFETYARPQLWHRGSVSVPFALVEPAHGLETRTGGRGLIAADLDEDGDLDVVIASAIGAPVVLENVREGKGNAVKLTLRASSPNPFAVGARVRVRANGRTTPFIVHAGLGYMSSGDPRVHLGVGVASTIAVDIDWPSGKTTRDLVLAAPGSHTITEP